MAKIAIGTDHGAIDYKTDVIKHLENLGHEVDDCGTNSTDSCDYPDFAEIVAEKVAAGICDFGILMCGTGIGMSIAANRFNGIRASHCTDTFTARMTRMHNNSNVLCLGERITGVGLALDIVDIWLNTNFEGGRHERRVNMLEGLKD